MNYDNVPIITTQAIYYNALINVASRVDRFLEVEDGPGAGSEAWVTALSELRAAMQLFAEIEGWGDDDMQEA